MPAIRLCASVPPDMAKLFGLVPERKLEAPTDFNAELVKRLEAAKAEAGMPDESEKAATAEEDFADLRRKLEEYSAGRR